MITQKFYRRYNINNNIEEDIKQLRSLKLDRESFLQNDTEHDEIYLKDIRAIENILADRKRLLDKANKYDSLIEKLQDKLIEEKEKISYYDEYIRLNMLEKVNVDIVDSRIDILQELLDTEKE